VLTRRIAVVTGSTSGIGRGIAIRFAELGARVVVHGRDEAGARLTLDAITAGGGHAVWHRADLSDAGACRGLIDFAQTTFGGLDILVNNAALTTRGDIESVPLDVVDSIFAVNLRAPLLLTQAAIPLLKVNGGAIVNIGSVNAYIGEPKLCPYSVSKGGLMTLTKNCASSLNKYRIRVNQINVGWTLHRGRGQGQEAGREGRQLAGRRDADAAVGPPAAARRCRQRGRLLRVGRQRARDLAPSWTWSSIRWELRRTFLTTVNSQAPNRQLPIVRAYICSVGWEGSLGVGVGGW
jgi:NAD(P)-dependent dehydrogenase (short-subunit alcohol dehydrogenase family)